MHNRRIHRAGLLLLAWAIFGAALPLPLAPGFGRENLPTLGLLVAPVLLPVNVMFLLSPALLVLSRHGRWRLAVRLLSGVMLGVWIPLLMAVRDRSAADFMLGYYLFAGAYTLAVISIQLPAPARPPRADRRRGFPVVMDGGPTQDVRS